MVQTLGSTSPWVFVLEEQIEVDYAVYSEPQYEPYTGTVTLQSTGEQIGSFVVPTAVVGGADYFCLLKDRDPKRSSDEPDGDDIDSHLPIRLEFLKPHIRAMYSGSYLAEVSSGRFWFREH